MRATPMQSAYMDRVRAMPCVLCAQLDMVQQTPTNLHHVREGQGMSERASHWLVVALCRDCHQGPLGLHGDRTLLRIAHADEMDLLAWTLEAVLS